MRSVVKHLAVGSRGISVHVRLQSGVALRLDVSGEQSSAVELEEGLKEVSPTVVHDALDLLKAGVLEEALVVEVGLIELDRAAIVAQHELLEGHEAHVP